MAKLMHKSLINKKIRDLSATYLTLSFAEIAAKTNLQADSIEASITQMVSKRLITARINKKQSTVDFIEEEADDDSTALVSQTNFEMIKTIETQNARIVKLLGRVNDANDKIKQSDDYVTTKARKSMQRAAGGDEDNGDEYD